MSSVLVVIALVSGAWLLARKVVEGLRARFLVTTGAEYILVGLLLGPAMPWRPALAGDVLAGLSPLMVLAVGWVGLIYGMDANLRTMVQRRDALGMLVLVEVGASALAAGATAWFLLGSGRLGALDPVDRQVATWVLAASAGVGSTLTIDLVRRRFRAEGPVTDLLGRASRLGELISIVGFGLLFCVHHQGWREATAGWNYANWILVTGGLGLGLGVLFRLFLGSETDPDRQFLALLGIVVFASGAAQYLRLSPLLVNLLLGVVLANVAPNAEQIAATLGRYQGAMRIVLLVFAGALWRPVPAAGLVLALAYVAVRFAAKLGGGLLASWNAPDEIPRDIGRGLLGHGEVAVAMALGFRLVYQGPGADLAFAAILLSVVVNDAWSARAVRRLLIDHEEIQPDRRVAAAPAGGEV